MSLLAMIPKTFKMMSENKFYKNPLKTKLNTTTNTSNPLKNTKDHLNPEKSSSEMAHYTLVTPPM